MLEVMHVEQFVLFGEQNMPSDMQDVESPLVTLWPLGAPVHPTGWPTWPLAAQVPRPVSPTEMLTVLGLNVSVPPGATVTSTIVPVAEGTPLTAGWPF